MKDLTLDDFQEFFNTYKAQQANTKVFTQADADAIANQTAEQARTASLEATKTYIGFRIENGAVPTTPAPAVIEKFKAKVSRRSSSDPAEVKFNKIATFVLNNKNCTREQVAQATGYSPSEVSTICKATGLPLRTRGTSCLSDLAKADVKALLDLWPKKSADRREEIVGLAAKHGVSDTVLYAYARQLRFINQMNTANNKA